MKRRLANFVLVVLLLLTFATVCGWFRSYMAPEHWQWNTVVQHDAQANRFRLRDFGHAGGSLYVAIKDYVELDPDGRVIANLGRTFHHERIASRLGFVNRLGFGLIRLDIAPTVMEPNITHRGFALAVPYWFLLILFATPPAIVLVRRRLHARRTPAGHCPTCGYDLRASTERCPECGTTIANQL